MSAVMTIIICACSGPPLMAGDPDPGHRSMAALEPVLSVIPAGVHIMFEHRVASRWDSCDGVPSTHGWDPITVNAEFTATAPSQQVAAHVRTAMGKLGWAYLAKNSDDRIWVWSRDVDGRTASATLQIDKSAAPPLWSLVAIVPPAAHPVAGC